MHHFTDVSQDSHDTSLASLNTPGRPPKQWPESIDKKPCHSQASCESCGEDMILDSNSLNSQHKFRAKNTAEELRDMAIGEALGRLLTSKSNFKMERYET